MVPPRKTATYGKPSRRPVSDFSAFAEPFEDFPAHDHQRFDKSRGLTGENVGESLLRRSESPQKISSAKKARSTKMQSCADSRIGDAHRSVTLHGFPSTGEAYERDSFTIEAGSRKKRRLTPPEDPSLALKVFESDKLPHYVAADPREKSKTTDSISKKAVQEPKGSMALVRDSLDASKNEDTLVIEVGALKSKAASSSKKIPSSKSNKPQMSIAKKQPTTRFQEKQKASLGKSNHELPEDQKRITKPQRLSMTPTQYEYLAKSPAPSDPESQQAQGEEEFLPSTPPRPVNAAGIASSPKQQELWHKVLANDLGRNSLKHLNIGSHGLQGEEQVPSQRTELSRPQNDNRNGSINAGKRSGKLIDFLMSSTQDSSVSEHRDSEDHGSSDAERAKSVQSDVSTNDEILTMQTSPSVKNQSKGYQLQDYAPPPINQSVPSIKGIPKITYIRERTHLGESDHRDAAMLDAPLDTCSGIARDHQWRAMGKLQGESQSLDNVSEGLGEGEDSQGGPMRSIHELREAGGNSRIAGELEAILDDLEDRTGSSMATRRTSLLNLASKLLEASTCHMLIDQGLELRFLAQLNFSHDIFERLLLAASVLQIVFNTTSTIFLSQVNHVRMTNILIGLLDQTQDLSVQIKLRENKISRLAQGEFVAFYSAFLRLPVWRALKPPMISGQILALQCLNLLVLQAREAACQTAILSFDALSRIAETCIPLPGTVKPESPYSRTCLELAVSILESSTKGDPSPNKNAEWTNAALEHLTGLFPLLSEESSLENGNLQSLTLRLYLNLTNTSPQLCEIFSTRQIISTVCRTIFLQFHLLSGPENQRQDLQVLEKLVLSLGYLINLAEFSDSMRMMMVESEIKDQTPLEILLQLFLKRKKAAEAYSEVEAENNVAFGYLSVLLSYLCLNKTIRLYVIGRPEGPTLRNLLDALEEFLQYHKQIEDGRERGEGRTDRNAGFVSRLQVLADELRVFV